MTGSCSISSDVCRHLGRILYMTGLTLRTDVYESQRKSYATAHLSSSTKMFRYISPSDPLACIQTLERTAIPRASLPPDHILGQKICRESRPLKSVPNKLISFGVFPSHVHNRSCSAGEVRRRVERIHRAGATARHVQDPLHHPPRQDVQGRPRRLYKDLSAFPLRRAIAVDERSQL
jgi:hypothetical protein